MIKLIVAVLFASSVVLAQAETNSIPVLSDDKHLEISAAVGPNWFNSMDAVLIISPFETDRIHLGDISNGATWKVGVGYYLNTSALVPPFLDRYY